jgi:Fe2+ transport system protein FeoA
MAEAEREDGALPLCELRPGEVGRVVEKRLDEADRAVLRAMGLNQDSTVRLCRAGEPCIVAVMSGGREDCGAGELGGGGGGGVCRIGLARPLAERVYVQVRGRGVSAGKA